MIDLIVTLYPVFIGILLLGGVCGVVGSFSVLRREAMMSDALSHAALPGACLSFFLLGEKNIIGGLIATLICGFLTSFIVRMLLSISVIPKDAALSFSIGWNLSFGLILLQLVQSSPLGNKAGLGNFLYGRAASMTVDEVQASLVVTLAALVCIVIYKERLKIFCFDELFFSCVGPSRIFTSSIIIFLTLSVSLVALPSVGAIVLIAFFIIPGTIAKRVTTSFEATLVYSFIIGSFGALFGALLSILLSEESSKGVATGPTMVLCLSSILILIFAAKKYLFTTVIK